MICLIENGRVEILEETDSTNAYVKRLADEKENGYTALARLQTAGRGRFNRKWLSGRDEGACFSVLVKDSRLSAETAPPMVFVCALAAARALTKLTGCGDIRIKWPNDLVLHGKKLCGILCESAFAGDRIAWTVCGIGINLTQTAFPADLPHASSVKKETGVTLTPVQTVNAFLEEFDLLTEVLFTRGLQPVLDEIVPLSATLGQTVRAENGEISVTGQAVRFEQDGSLVVAANGEEQRVRVGDVSVRGIMGYV